MCAEPIPDAVVTCPHCRSSLQAGPPPDPNVPTREKLIREISIFLIGLGVLLGLGGIAMLVYGNPDRLFVTGLLLIFAGVAGLVCGGGLLATRQDGFAYAGAGVMGILFLGIFGLAVLAGRGFNLGIVVAGLVPVVLVQRVTLLRKAR